MKVLPVITRELRAQARQPFTYWLRELSVVALFNPQGIAFRGLPRTTISFDTQQTLLATE